jgi:signal transduction histidine kinase
LRLGTKIAAAISLVFTVLLGSAAVGLAVNEVEFIAQEMDFHGRLLGHVVASAAEPTLPHSEREARIRELTEREERIAVQWLDIDPSRPADRPAALPEELWDKLRQGEVVGRISPADDDMLYTYVPLTAPGGPTRVIEIAESLEASHAHISALILRVIGGTTLGLLLSGAVAYVLGTRLVGRPVSDLIEVARHVGSGDFSHRADESRSDELGTLAREMNAMAANLAQAQEAARDEEEKRLRMQAQLEHADRLATLGQLASGVAHEIGTPLQSITIRAEIIGQTAGHIAGVPDCVRQIQRQSGRVATIVRNLLRFARKQPSRRVPRDLGKIVENTLMLVQTAQTKGPVELVSRLDCDARMATVDEEQIEQVLANLIINGMHAMPSGGKVTVGLERADVEPPPDVEQPADDYVCLSVQDEGTGIPDDVLPHLFDPFFTTKAVGEGTGLGLSISYGIVREHGGWIDVETSRGHGSRFCVYLPAGPGSESMRQHAV